MSRDKGNKSDKKAPAKSLKEKRAATAAKRADTTRERQIHI